MAQTAPPTPQVWEHIRLQGVHACCAGLGAERVPEFTQVGFRIKGPDKQDETFYFDDVMLVK